MEISPSGGCVCMAVKFKQNVKSYTRIHSNERFCNAAPPVQCGVNVGVLADCVSVKHTYN